MTITFLLFICNLNAQDKNYYGIVVCTYTSSDNNTVYISKPIKVNKYYERQGLMGSAYTKNDLIEKGLKKDFKSKLSVQKNIKIPGNVDGGSFLSAFVGEYFDASGQKYNSGCDLCMWGYEDAVNEMNYYVNSYSNMGRIVILIE